MTGAFSIRRSQPADVPALLRIWRRSVDATHDFLSGEDRAAIDRAVAHDYLPFAQFLVAIDPEGAPVGFLGSTGREIDSLFVDPAVHGRGVGRLLVESFARSAVGSLRVEVNEQNAGACAFYERLGFRVTGRSPLDGQGRAYPLLQLER